MTSAAGTSTLRRLTARENQVYLALTVLIAVIAGLAAVLFTLAIQGVQHTLFGISPSSLRLLMVPMLVSLVTGFLLHRYFPDARGSGIPQTKVAFHLKNGEISDRVALGKFLTGALCVGSGHSMGREGPSVQIGAGLASSIGRRFRLSPERARNLIPIGATAALAAAFNTPISAVLFSLEEIIGDMNASLIGMTVVASVTAVVVERSILGDETLFRVPAYHLVHPAELIGYALLGLIGGLISVLFCKGLLWLRGLFKRMPRRSVVFQPAIGGLAIGVILLFVPQVMGVGYEYVDQALNGGLLFRVMAMLCFAKLFATIISYSSGNAGGIFAPSLYLGAMAGGAFGSALQLYAPFPTGGPGAYALVGMGVLFAGIVRAPMTSVFMIFELTHDHQILVPLMVANLISFAVSKHYLPSPVYHALLEQDRVYLPHSEVPVKRSFAWEVMTRDVLVLPGATPIFNALQQMNEFKANVCLVGTWDEFIGVVNRKSLKEAAGNHQFSQTLAAAVNANFAFVHADDVLETALERMAEAEGMLPVLSRMGRKLEGAITIDTIMDFVQKQSGNHEDNISGEAHPQL